MTHLQTFHGMKMIRNAGCGKDHCAAIVTNTLQMNLPTTSTANGSAKYAWKDISGSLCLKNESIHSKGR